MTDSFVKSARLVNKYILLVVLIGVFHVSFFGGPMVYVSIVGLIVASLLGVIVGGKIVGNLENQEEKSWVILRENWLNYLVVLLVLGVPTLFLNQTAGFVPVSLEVFIAINGVIKAIVWLISMYVLPIVFIRIVFTLASEILMQSQTAELEPNN